VAIKNNPLRAAAIGIPVDRRLIDDLISESRRSTPASPAACWRRRTRLHRSTVFSFDRSADLLLLVLISAAVGYLMAAYRRDLFKVMQDYLRCSHLSIGRSGSARCSSPWC